MGLYPPLVPLLHELQLISDQLIVGQGFPHGVGRCRPEASPFSFPVGRGCRGAEEFINRG